MRSYLAFIKATLKLVMRDRLVLFFNYILPLIFFVVFAQSFHAERGGAIHQILTMVLILGVLGSGFFGAGMRAVQERETNILRRFKVAPITPLPILVASLVTGWLSYLPSVLIVLGIAHFYYRMPWPENWLSLLALQSLGLVAFRSVGLIIASVVNSMQESQIVIQLLYLPMLFLSGATFPVDAFPGWLQIVAQYLPTSYLYTGLQGILLQKDTLREHTAPVLALLTTLAVSLFISVKLFRWEKDETVAPSAKLWIGAVLLPFLLLGSYQAYTKENVSKAKAVLREMRRNSAVLIRGPRIFVGDGRVIPAGGVLVQNGKIVEVFDSVPSEKDFRAETLEAQGKTLLPGLIDFHVHLLGPGGVADSDKNFQPEDAVQRALAAYLFCGVTAVRSAGDTPAILSRPQARIARGELLGAELFHSGKMFTVAGGHGTQFFEQLPPGVRQLAERETLFLPANAAQARQQVRENKAAGASATKAVLEAGFAGMLFPRLEVTILRAIAEESRAQGLPLTVHTGDKRDVSDALGVQAASIEHGSARELLPSETLQALAKQRIYYDPTLAVIEALEQLASGKPDLLDSSLVQQVAPEGLIDRTRKALTSPAIEERRQRLLASPTKLKIAMENLRRAWEAGVPLVAGSDAGNLLLVHGPGIHRELQLWVKAGIPATVALQAATLNAARLLGVDHRIGAIRKGNDATMLLVDGNPLEEIAATERISAIFFRGERVTRAGLFKQE
ncbi:MAG: amidohydrolase family protein [Bryobacteraceae bacterium]|nr:amidohydrolase family protein [Bryobacteraceae bacterium]MDW8380407.1 amidohydrolase family protein [Bryobacterales bacterium]